MNSVLHPLMDAQHKKVLKSISLELRHLLEGSYDAAGEWYPGDLEQRLAGIGVRRDREPVGVDELSHLPPADQKARQVVDAYLQLRAVERNSFRSPADDTTPPSEIRSHVTSNGMNSVLRQEAVAEFVRETAYTWANRLLALRCMEARELIDEVILQKAAYGGRSLEHHRLAQRQPELCTGEDDGLLAVLDRVFAEQAGRLPMLFDPNAPGVALRPSAAAIKRCMALLSGTEAVAGREPATADVFKASDALGWAYQYWNTEEKDRVFEKVRTVKGAKIAGADIVPATQLYTEDYMVKFLVQNSLGATWMGMHPESKLCERWEYYVRDADRAERNDEAHAKAQSRKVEELTFLDPACGSGHFLLEAFDLFYDMYQEEDHLRALAPSREPSEICDAILTKNLFGIDIDPRAVQIAEAALWMKAAERAFDYQGAATNLVAATASHLKGRAWDEFLAGFEDEPSVARVLRKFAQTMQHIDEIGSLARPAEDLREIIRQEHATWERQVRERKEANFLFAEMNEDALRGQLPFHEISDEDFGDRLFYRARAGIDAFTERAREAGKRDLYAAFILRNLELAVERNSFRSGRTASSGDPERNEFRSTCCGRVAMVTQQAWMFLRSFAELRAVDQDQLERLPSDAFRGLLRDATLETLAHLGPAAFGEISGEVVNTVLFTLSNTCPPAEHRLTAFRLIGPKSPEENDALLRQALRGQAAAGTM